MKKFLLVTMLFAFVAGFAYAQAPAAPAAPAKQEMKVKKERPCKEDKKTFCPGKKGKEARACLKAVDISKLSPACQARIAAHHNDKKTK